MTSSLATQPLIYTERTDDDSFEPTQADIEEFAKRIGLDISSEPELLFLAREGLRAPLPDGWKPCRQRRHDRDVWFYYNSKIHTSQWEHPMDSVYRAKVLQARSELAVDQVQSFDPLTKGPSKSLAPLKRSRSSMNSIVRGKVPGLGQAAFANLDPLNRLQSSSSPHIICGNSLKSFKDTENVDDSARPQRKKSSLEITGGGSSICRGSEGLTKTWEGEIHYGNVDHFDETETYESDFGGAGDSDNNQIKSSLVNSVFHFRPKTLPDSFYELEDISTMKLAMSEEMEAELKIYKEQLENERKSRQQQIHNNLEETIAQFQLEKENALQTKRNELTDEYQKKIDALTVEFRDKEEKYISIMKQTISDEMEAELKNFKEQLESERKSRQNQIQKHFEATVAQFKSEKEHTIKKLRKEMETEQAFEIYTAKREIDGLLQKELEELKIKFENSLQTRRKKLEENHQKKIDALTSEFLKKEDEKISNFLNLKQKKVSDEAMKVAEIEVIRRGYQRLSSISEDTHQRIVEDAKAFIKMQKNRLKDPTPLPNSSHLLFPTTKNNHLLFDEKLLKSISPRRTTSIHLDLVSETESSSNVNSLSLKDHRNPESKKLSKDVHEIYNSLISLDQQMKFMWSDVKDKHQQSYY